MHFADRLTRLVLSVLPLVFPGIALGAEGETAFGASAATFKKFCFDCHGDATAEAQVNLERMTAQPAFDSAFKKWEKVAQMLESGRMPPKDMPQPSAEQRLQLVSAIRKELRRAAEENAGDP